VAGCRLAAQRLGGSVRRRRWAARVSAEPLGGGMSMGRFLEAIGLKRQPPPSDPIFRFKKFYNFAAPYWEAEAEFATAGGSVEALVSCPRSGASPSQHSFFRDLEARYREALAAAHQAIGRELSTSAAGAVLPTADSLRLVCVSVPEAPPDAEWELSFEDLQGVHYAVAFQGWAPSRVEVTPC